MSSWWRQVGAPPLTRFAQVTYERYGVAYVEVTYFADRAGLRAHVGREAGGDRALEALIQGQVASATRVRYLMGVSAEKLRAFRVSNLQRYWPKGTFDPEATEAQAFLSQAGCAVDPDDRMEYLFRPEGTLHLQVRRSRPRRYTAPALVKAVRAFELTDQVGNASAQEALRGGLAKLLREPASGGPAEGAGPRRTPGRP